jgi:hypothetical protein
MFLWLAMSMHAPSARKFLNKIFKDDISKLP